MITSLPGCLFYFFINKRHSVVTHQSFGGIPRNKTGVLISPLKKNKYTFIPLFFDVVAQDTRNHTECSHISYIPIYCYSHALPTVAIRQSFCLVFDNFLTSFRQLSNGFSLHLANQNAKTVSCKVVNCRKANMEFDSTFPSSPLWLVSLKGSHQKVVKKMSQSCQKLMKFLSGGYG